MLPSPCVIVHPQNHGLVQALGGAPPPPPSERAKSDPPSEGHRWRLGKGGWGVRGGRGLGKWEPPWEFPCQRAHLTASLMEAGDVPQGPDGIQWSARWQLVKGGQASWIMESQQSTPPNPTAALMWKCFNLSVNTPLCCRNINRPLRVCGTSPKIATLSKSGPSTSAHPSPLMSKSLLFHEPPVKSPVFKTACMSACFTFRTVSFWTSFGARWQLTRSNTLVCARCCMHEKSC